MSNIKLIITDLDNTLLNSNKEVSLFTEQTLNKCANLGIYIAFATARPYLAVSSYIKKSFPNFVITDNGAVIYENGKSIITLPINKTIAHNFLADCLSSEYIKAVSMQTLSLQYTNDTEVSAWGKEWGGVYSDFKTIPNEDFIKISTLCNDIDSLKTLAQKYPNLILFANSADNWQQLTCKQATKMSAIKHLCNYLSINTNNVVCFGDDYNDIDMIKGCGVGVAVDNALSELKENANYICESNNSNGVAKWLINYLNLK